MLKFKQHEKLKGYYTASYGNASYTVRRNDRVAAGYWGRWNVMGQGVSGGSQGFATMREAKNYANECLKQYIGK